jgi:DNA-binding XRE family transcriptional regulator
LNQLAPILKAGRERNDWTQDYVADAAEIERKTYSTYENGKREPKFEVLIKLIKILGVTKEITALFSEQNVPCETDGIQVNSAHPGGFHPVNLEDVAQGLLALHGAVQKIAGKTAPLNPVVSAGKAAKEIRKDILDDKGKSRKAKIKKP